MKINFKYIITMLVITINLIIINVNAASNPYPKTSSYGTNCTWYAWKMANENANVTLPNFGNAKDWYNNAKNAGYQVGSTPKSKSIVVWGDWTSYGHVGYIERVENNIIYVWDSTGPCIDEEDPEYIECMANGVSEESDKICKANAKRVACKYNISESDYTITGYIYLDNVPKTTTKTTTKTPTTKKKSNNANLTNIELSSGTIDFDKEVYNYNLDVENEITTITINATLEDKNASLSGIGDYELKLGTNEIKLIVTAEDNTSKEYIININRKEKAETLVTTTKHLKQSTNENKNIISIMVGGISLLTFIVIIIIIVKKIKNKK